MSQIQKPDWMISDDEKGEDDCEASANIKTKPLEIHVKVDAIKLENLLKRRKVYGDITQNATESQLQRLMVRIVTIEFKLSKLSFNYSTVNGFCFHKRLRNIFRYNTITMFH